MNAALVEPAATVKDEGIETPEPPLNATVSPPLGAGADSVSVHEAAPGVVNVAG